LFLNLFSAKNLRIIVPAVLLIILIPLIFVLMQGKREVKKEEILPPVKVEEKIEEKKEPKPLEAGEATPVQTQEIVLQIFSDPPHARVLVDGVEMGETPLFIPMKEKGEITIRLEKSGYLPSTRKVLIDPAEGDRKIEINLKPVETISINLDVITEPEGARVFIDGRLIGITPVRAFPLQYGTHSINVEKDGYTPRQDEVKVIKSGKQTVSFVLEPLQKIEEERIPSVGELVEMSEKVVRPKRISGDFPSTPSNFGKRGRFSVTLSFIVDEKGDVKEINIEESSGERDLDLAAMRALQNWKFTSPTLKGIKVKVRLRQKFTFVIE
ncbi:MAG: TonB family protein, partial [Candidatus Aminicenantia bacterium]